MSWGAIILMAVIFSCAIAWYIWRGRNGKDDFVTGCQSGMIAISVLFFGGLLFPQDFNMPPAPWTEEGKIVQAQWEKEQATRRLLIKINDGEPLTVEIQN